MKLVRFAIVLLLPMPCLAMAWGADQLKVEVLAGTGQAGYAGDGGPAKQAAFNQPFHCIWTKDGDKSVLYVVEQLNHCVRRIDLTSGTIMTVAGNGKPGYAESGSGPAAAVFNDPHAIDLDPEGNLYVADRLNFAVRKVNLKTGMVTTLAGTGKKGSGGDGGPATQARLVEPDDCAYDGKGGLLIADVGDWRIRRVDLKTGIITTFAGTGRVFGKIDRTRIGDGGPAIHAIVPGARAVCADHQGNVFICEREGHAIRKISPDGMIHTVAGTGQSGYTGDGGDARQASLNGPKAIRCDSNSNVFVADTENHAIRRIDGKTNVITTVVGERIDPAHKLNRPHGCIVDPQGNLYVADSGNNRILLVRNQ